MVDFQTAHQEILKEQEARLREKLDAEKYAALQEIQNEHMRNENNYLDKMAKLKLEKFRFKCSKKILESEKKAIENQLELQKESLDYQPYQSNLLDEIPKIFQHSSEQFLHRTKLMVSVQFYLQNLFIHTSRHRRSKKPTNDAAISTKT